MTGYYTENLAAERLRRCYEIAPPRVRQYLEAEVQHVVARLSSSDEVLELGCGYGRVLPSLARVSGRVVGIDTCLSSLRLARSFTSDLGNCSLMCMDASQLGFAEAAFDRVVCIQNGISAFHVDRRRLILEAIRVCRPGGLVMFSSYADRFWSDRLEWFELQAEDGLIGEIDYQKTGNGVIVCRDGFTASTVSPEEFESITGGLSGKTAIVEVDGSSVFCEIVPGHAAEQGCR